MKDNQAKNLITVDFEQEPYVHNTYRASIGNHKVMIRLYDSERYQVEYTYCRTLRCKTIYTETFAEAKTVARTILTLEQYGYQCR